MNINRKLALVKILRSNPNLSELCLKIKQLTEHKESIEIEQIIKSLNLPLKEHLFVLGNYSDLMSLNYEV